MQAIQKQKKIGRSYSTTLCTVYFTMVHSALRISVIVHNCAVRIQDFGIYIVTNWVSFVYACFFLGVSFSITVNTKGLFFFIFGNERDGIVNLLLCS